MSIIISFTIGALFGVFISTDIYRLVGLVLARIDRYRIKKLVRENWELKRKLYEV